jgi:hypothetical protein
MCNPGPIRSFTSVAISLLVMVLTVIFTFFVTGRAYAIIVSERALFIDLMLNEFVNPDKMGLFTLSTGVFSEIDLRDISTEIVRNSSFL